MPGCEDTACPYSPDVDGFPILLTFWYNIIFRTDFLKISMSDKKYFEIQTDSLLELFHLIEV